MEASEVANEILNRLRLVAEQPPTSQHSIAIGGDAAKK